MPHKEDKVNDAEGKPEDQNGDKARRIEGRLDAPGGKNLPGVNGEEDVNPRLEKGEHHDRKAHALPVPVPQDEDHVQILELLIRIGREDIIFRCHEKNVALLHRRYGELQRLASAHPAYFMAVRTGFTISILSAWIRGGKRESTEELLSIMEEQVTLLQKNWRGSATLW